MADQHQRSHHTPLPGQIPVPSGPEEYDTVDGRIVNPNGDFAYNDKDEKAIFQHLLHPSDMYTADGTFWADLPFGKRLNFIRKVDNEEASRELKNIGRMIKEDPLSPVGWYFANCVLPGAGLLLEGYVLFSIGNLTSLYSAAWPECWKTHKVCDKKWIDAVSYLEVAGIMVGQILVGLIGDGIGRRWGLIQDAAIMFVGLVMLIASWGTTLNGWVICYAWSLFFYGIGVGGEYPMTATSGMENGSGSGKVSTREDRLHRGRKVVSAFLMQGWGQFFNQAILILLLLIFHHGSGNPPYSTVAVQWTFRISFALPAIGTLWLVYFRTYKMPLASKQLEEFKKKQKVTGYDVESLKLTIGYFGPRLIGTAGAWFCNDVFFYGNKLFQSQFIAVISPNSKGVITNWLWNLLNCGVSLCGYYLSSFLIDAKWYGRKHQMQVGFLMDFILFVVPAFHYTHYTSAAHIKEFQAMYFLSSFFNQFGPNTVTFLVAAEVFPTSVRASAHGFGAATGKLGALFASILYNYINTQTKFYVVPWFGLAGMLLTGLFLPDTTGLDLKECDRRWQFIREGREHEYHGIAIHRQHLSWWEIFRGHHKNYNAELDYKQKVDELRAEWEARYIAKHSGGDESDTDVNADEPLGQEIHNYFERTSPIIKANDKTINEKLNENI